MATVAATDVPPAFRPFLAIHDAVRRDLCAVVGAIRAIGPFDPAGMAALATPFGDTLHGLEVHHQVEDEVLYPALVAFRPELADVVAALEAEHRRLDELVAAVRTGMTELSSPGAADRTALHECVLAAAAELAALMDDHLAREEADLLPAFVEAFTEEEVLAMEHGHRHLVRRRDVGSLTPWVLSAMPGNQRQATVAAMPAPLRALYQWVWFPRFTRRYAPLLAFAPAPAAA